MRSSSITRRTASKRPTSCASGTAYSSPSIENALTEALGVPVKECVLYSFALSCEIVL